MTRSYNLTNIRTLLIEGFSDEELNARIQQFFFGGRRSTVGGRVLEEDTYGTQNLIRR